MNASQFNISLKDAISFIQEIGLFKSVGVKTVGQYSEEIKKISKTKNHREIYECAIKNLDYEILLTDDSIFQFSYNAGELRYAFIQNPAKFVSKEDYLTYILTPDEINEIESVDDLLELVNENEYEQFLNEQELNSTSNILRYDASSLGYKPLIHPFSHIHIGLNSDFRIPVSILLTPLTFAKFCIKNTYYEIWKNAFTIIEDFPNRILQSKNLCNLLDNKQWSEIEKAELYLK